MRLSTCCFPDHALRVVLCEQKSEWFWEETQASYRIWHGMEYVHLAWTVKSKSRPRDRVNIIEIFVDEHVVSHTLVSIRIVASEGILEPWDNTQMILKTCLSVASNLSRKATVPLFRLTVEKAITRRMYIFKVQVQLRIVLDGVSSLVSLEQLLSMCQHARTLY